MEPCYTTNTIDLQVLKVREESHEVLKAMLDKKYEHALEELQDLKQSIVTLEDIFRRNGYDVDAAERQMIEKCERRGYYDDPNLSVGAAEIFE